MGEVFPGGPATLPCTVEICGETYTASPVPSPMIIYLCAKSQWGILAEKYFRLDQGKLAARLHDPEDPLDVTDLGRAAISLSVRLAGVGDGIIGWRALMRLSGHIVQDWRDMSGRLLASGVDITRSDLWKIISTGLHILRSGASKEDLDWIDQVLEHPLPVEPAFLPGAGELPASQQMNPEAFAQLQREMR